MAAKVLGSKYVGPNQFQHNRMHSKIWKNICLGADIVKKHAIWRVGNGEKIDTLNDNWIGHSSLAKWPTFVNALELPAMVSGLLCEDGSWGDQISTLFGDSLTEVIRLLHREDIGVLTSLFGPTLNQS